jgi:hypothetical protein
MGNCITSHGKVMPCDKVDDAMKIYDLTVEVQKHKDTIRTLYTELNHAELQWETAERDVADHQKKERHLEMTLANAHALNRRQVSKTWAQAQALADAAAHGHALAMANAVAETRAQAQALADAVAHDHALAMANAVADAVAPSAPNSKMVIFGHHEVKCFFVA